MKKKKLSGIYSLGHLGFGMAGKENGRTQGEREGNCYKYICIMVPLTTQDVLKRVVTANSLKFFFGKTIYGRIKLANHYIL